MNYELGIKKILVVANWKCNPTTLEEAKELFGSIAKGLKNSKNTEVIICPPFIYLPHILNTKYNIQLGAQDCFWEEKGAFTGEISPLMLKDLGCQYVIIGHPERRRYQKETDEMLNKKIKAAIVNDLKPILCVENVLQVKKRLKGIPKKELKNVILCYEPSYAISTSGGSGAIDAKQAIKSSRLFKKAAKNNNLLIYGGSVDASNVKKYINAGFDGVLVGSASLNAREFVKVVKNASRP